MRNPGVFESPFLNMRVPWCSMTWRNSPRMCSEVLHSSARRSSSVPAEVALKGHPLLNSEIDILSFLFPESAG